MSVPLPFDEDFLKILACPACAARPPLRWDAENAKLICTACGRRYPVRDGIPVLLADEAERP